MCPQGRWARHRRPHRPPPGLPPGSRDRCTLARCWTPHRCWPCCPPSSRPATVEASASATRCWHDWCAAGRVQPVRRGLFRLPPQLAADPHAGALSRIRAVAAVFAEDHAVSHLSAAALLGLPMPLGAPGPVHLTRLRACHRSRQAPDGVVIHHADSSVTPGGRAPRHTGDRGGADCRRLPAHVAADRLGPRRRRRAPPALGHAAAAGGLPRGPAPVGGDAPRPTGAVHGRRAAGDLAGVVLVRAAGRAWRPRLARPGHRPRRAGRAPGSRRRAVGGLRRRGRGRRAREVPRRRPRPDRGARGAGGSSPRRRARTPSATSAWRWCAGTSPRCSSGRYSWPRGSSAHGPGAAGPASAAGSSTDGTSPPSTGRTAAPESGHPVSEFGQRGASGGEGGEGQMWRREVTTRNRFATNAAST